MLQLVLPKCMPVQFHPRMRIEDARLPAGADSQLGIQTLPAQEQVDQQRLAQATCVDGTVSACQCSQLCEAFRCHSLTP